MFWLLNEALEGVENIIIILPVRGHSYLPADRVFDRAERILKKEDVIKTKEEYNQLYSQVGEVKELGKDWTIYNIKEMLKIYTKMTGIKTLKKI